MAKTVADLMIERLIDWGVDTIFGFPGDGINGIFESLRTRQDKIKFIQVRHEEAAAFAACGYAKYTGRLGGVPGDLGARRHTPAERPLRRQMRRPTGPGHHRPHVPRSDQHALPAGRGPGQVVHGRRRLQRADHGAGPRPQRRGRGHQDCPFPADGGALHHPQGHPGMDRLRRAALRGQHRQAQRRPVYRRLSTAGERPLGASCRPDQRRHQGGDSGRARLSERPQGSPGARRKGRRPDHQAPPRQGRGPGRQSRSPRGASACSARPPRRTPCRSATR